MLKIPVASMFSFMWCVLRTPSTASIRRGTANKYLIATRMDCELISPISKQKLNGPYIQFRNFGKPDDGGDIDTFGPLQTSGQCTSKDQVAYISPSFSGMTARRS